MAENRMLAVRTPPELFDRAHDDKHAMRVSIQLWVHTALKEFLRRPISERRTIFERVKKEKAA